MYVKKLRILRSDVGNANAHARVVDFAVTNQRLNHRVHDLRRNGKSHSGERARRRKQERVDANNFAASIDQGSTGVAGINRRIGLDELSGLASVGRRIRAIQSADDSTGNGKAKSE